MFTTIRILTDLGLAATAIYFAYSIVTRFRAAAGTFGERLLAAGHQSATVLVQRVIVIAASAAAIVPTIADVLGNTSVAAALQTVIPGGIAPYYMVAIAVLTELVRRRKGGGGVADGN